MFGLSGFFKNIQNSFTKEIFLRTAIKDAIKRQIGFEIEIENITCKGSVINIKNINQTTMSAIFIKKQKILEELKNSQNIRVINDIR